MVLLGVLVLTLMVLPLVLVLTLMVLPLVMALTRTVLLLILAPKILHHKILKINHKQQDLNTLLLILQDLVMGLSLIHFITIQPLLQTMIKMFLVIQSLRKFLTFLMIQLRIVITSKCHTVT